MEPSQEVHRSLPNLLVLQGETFGITRVLKKVLNGRFLVLNMASEKRAGGRVFFGTTAQEESLCMQSTLYSRLLEVTDGQYPLEPGQFIHTADVFVCFTNGHRALPITETFHTDVISMPAPICPPKTFAEGYATSANGIQMRKNIKTLMDAADTARAEVLILGAWGCGAYRNPPAEVARMFHAELSLRDRSRSSLTHVVFAILDERSGKPVWTAFENVFSNAVPGFMPIVIDVDGSILLDIWLNALTGRV